jgi:hypothetical protein
MNIHVASLGMGHLHRYLVFPVFDNEKDYNFPVFKSRRITSEDPVVKHSVDFCQLSAMTFNMFVCVAKEALLIIYRSQMRNCFLLDQ